METCAPGRAVPPRLTIQPKYLCILPACLPAYCLRSTACSCGCVRVDGCVRACVPKQLPLLYGQ